MITLDTYGSYDTLRVHTMRDAATPKSLSGPRARALRDAYIRSYCVLDVCSYRAEDVHLTWWTTAGREIKRYLHEDHALANALRGTGLVALIAGGVP